MIGLVLLVSLIGVFARMTFVYEDDGIYNIYESEIILEKGWNLVAFGELEGDSEIKEQDIKAVFYYNPSTKDYVRAFPESEEFNNLAEQNFCGDRSCSPEERADYASWCYEDCQFELNDDIVSNLNVLKEETFTLAEDEKKNIDFINDYDVEVYWSAGPLEEGAYPLQEDSIVLFWKGLTDGTYDGTHSDSRVSNTPNDGNPYNDNFGIANLFLSNNAQESIVYVKVDYGSNDKERVITFYEIDDPKVRSNNNLAIPSPFAKIISQPAWVYSGKKGLLKLESAVITLDLNPLQSGWNFITITPEFDGKTWNQISEPCDVLKAYVFDAEAQEWVNLNTIYSSGTFGEAAEQGQGIIMKVSSSCTLDISGSSGDPPTLP